MAQPLLTFKSVRGRRVSLSLKRPIASEGGHFGPGPVAPIHFPTPEGVIECGGVEPAWRRFEGPGAVGHCRISWRTPSSGVAVARHAAQRGGTVMNADAPRPA
jgi:hypothetical protein